jgi:hypothetical protein
MSKKIFVPTAGPETWKQLLAEPERQWRTGYSARSLAYCWENAENGFPAEVRSVFEQSGEKAFRRLELLYAFPEYQVPLPGGGRPSQNDLLVVAKSADDGLVTIAVEGKVAESFDKTLADWHSDESKGKTERLAFLQDLLGLPAIPLNIRYQLLHRTASAVMEAQKLNATQAVMLVHSFSPENLWFEDFAAFAALFEIQAELNHLHLARKFPGLTLYLGWVKGNPEFLKA